MATEEPEEPEVALLRALGARAREQETEDVDDALPPIEGAEATALFDAVLERTQKPQSSQQVDRHPFGGAEFDALLASPDRVLPPMGRRRWLLALAAGLMVAAVGTTVLLRGPPDLPGYTLASGAGDQTTRSDPTATARARYSAGSRVHLIARPGVDVAEPLTVAVFVRQGGTTTRLEAPVQISGTGAVRLDAVAGETLMLPEGEGELILVVRPKSLDVTDEALLDAADPAPARRLVHPYHFAR